MLSLILHPFIYSFVYLVFLLLKNNYVLADTAKPANPEIHDMDPVLGMLWERQTCRHVITAGTAAPTGTSLPDAGRAGLARPAWQSWEDSMGVGG